MKNKNNNLIFFILLFITLIPYLNIINNTFHFDDFHMITKNAYIRSFKFLPLYFKGKVSSLLDKGYMYRPLIMITYNLNYFLHGTSPYGYYIFNILIHFFNVLLLFLIIYHLFGYKNRIIPFLTSVLFAIHPINCDAVAYISSRSGLLVTLFILLFFYFQLLYEKFQFRRYFVSSILFFIFALFSKETAIVVPGLYVAWFYFSHKSIRRNLGKILIIFSIALAYIFLRILIYSQINNPIYVRSFWSNILIQAKVTIFYLRLFLFPYPLSIDHQNLIPAGGGLISVFLLFFFFLILIFWGRKNFFFGFGFSWYLISLFPKFYGRLNFVASEHHFYLPSIGIYIFLSYIFLKLYHKYRKYFCYFLIATILIFSELTFFRSLDWDDYYTIWRSTYKTNPNSPAAINNFALYYVRLGLYDEGISLLKKMFSLYPSQDIVFKAVMNLTECYRVKKEYKKALQFIRIAHWMAPNSAPLYNEMGLIYMNMGEDKKAIECWEKALKLNPYIPEASLNLGIYKLKKGKFKEAKTFFHHIIKTFPENAYAWLSLGIIKEKEGNLEKAIEYYQKAAKLNPNLGIAHAYLGALYLKKADPKALHELKTAFKLIPNDPNVNYNLGLLYLCLKSPNKKLASYYMNRAKFLGYRVEDKLEKMIYGITSIP
jgi:tetratricopeptide (TPR) repeat protein